MFWPWVQGKAWYGLMFRLLRKDHTFRVQFCFDQSWMCQVGLLYGSLRGETTPMTFSIQSMNILRVSAGQQVEILIRKGRRLQFQSLRYPPSSVENEREESRQVKSDWLWLGNPISKKNHTLNHRLSIASIHFGRHLGCIQHGAYDLWIESLRSELVAMDLYQWEAWHICLGLRLDWIQGTVDFQFPQVHAHLQPV